MKTHQQASSDMKHGETKRRNRKEKLCCGDGYYPASHATEPSQRKKTEETERNV